MVTRSSPRSVLTALSAANVLDEGRSLQLAILALRILQPVALAGRDSRPLSVVTLVLPDRSS